MSDEYDYDDDKWEPSEKDELTAIRHTLKRMETMQSYIKNYLFFISAMLGLIILKFVFEMDSWLWT
jgi:hypothetical protein